MSDQSYLLRQYEISSYLVNSKRELGLPPFLNLLQDAASTHADALGFGYHQMKAAGTFWVLSRQKLQMSVWPKWHEIIKIKTWIRMTGGPINHRDFTIVSGDKVIGECTTSWVAVDATTRRAVNFDRTKFLSPLSDMGKVNLEAVKISRQDNLHQIASFIVRNSDIDQNLHVNNTKYAQWVLDAQPFEWLSQHTILNYSVNFLAETFLNDCISIFATKEVSSDESSEMHFEGIRTADNKCVFTARLNYR
jgi:medium-chain acyl-[acyl-carrier-protein] hydrolase